MRFTNLWCCQTRQELVSAGLPRTSAMGELEVPSERWLEQGFWPEAVCGAWACKKSFSSVGGGINSSHLLNFSGKTCACCIWCAGHVVARWTACDMLAAMEQEVSQIWTLPPPGGIAHGGARGSGRWLYLGGTAELVQVYIRVEGL